jgi:hypothetical protein
MKDVTALVRDRVGVEYTDNVAMRWPKMPLAVLYAGQAIHLKLNLSFGQQAPGSVVVRWADQRRGTQEREIWLSYQRIT